MLELTISSVPGARDNLLDLYTDHTHWRERQRQPLTAHQ